MAATPLYGKHPSIKHVFAQTATPFETPFYTKIKKKKKKKKKKKQDQDGCHALIW